MTDLYYSLRLKLHANGHYFVTANLFNAHYLQNYCLCVNWLNYSSQFSSQLAIVCLIHSSDCGSVFPHSVRFYWKATMKASMFYLLFVQLILGTRSLFYLLPNFTNDSNPKMFCLAFWRFHCWERYLLSYLPHRHMFRVLRAVFVPLTVLALSCLENFDSWIVDLLRVQFVGDVVFTAGRFINAKLSVDVLSLVVAVLFAKVLS